MQKRHIGKFLRLLIVSGFLLSIFTVGLGDKPALAVVQGPGNFSNAAIADTAMRYASGGDRASHYGSTWGGNACSDAGVGLINGQCRQFANCILRMVSGGVYYSNYTYGALVSSSEATRGDIIEVLGGAHTAIILANLGGNNFSVIDSNYHPWGQPDDELVRVHNWNPYTWRDQNAPGTAVEIRRFGQVSASSGGGGGFAGVAGATFLGKSGLSANQALGPNQYLLSEDARYVLFLQPDGNLVIYNNLRGAVWNSGTAGRAVTALIMQGDGNLVLYGPSGPIWYTNTTTPGGNPSLIMQPDGNLVIYGPSGAVWASHTSSPHPAIDPLNPVGADSRAAGQALYPGQYIRSWDKRYVLALQYDGNLVLWAPGYRVLWSSGTSGRAVSFAFMQHDGNFVLYGPNGAVWSTQTFSSSAVLMIQPDGNLVIYGPNGAIWSTGTAGRL